MNCSRCDIKVPQGRIDMGYTICTECSTEEKVSCHTIYPHKTGGYIQVISKEQSENLNRLDRRGTSKKTARHEKVPTPLYIGEFGRRSGRDAFFTITACVKDPKDYKIEK